MDSGYAALFLIVGTCSVGIYQFPWYVSQLFITEQAPEPIIYPEKGWVWLTSLEVLAYDPLTTAMVNLD